MKRRWLAVAGSVVVVLAGYLASRGPMSPRTTLGLGLVGAGGVLVLVGGNDPFPGRLAWNRLVGAGLVLLGAAFIVLWVGPALGGDGSSDAMILAATGLVNAIILGLVGVDWFLGGVFFDLSAVESGPLFGGGETEEA